MDHVRFKAITEDELESFLSHFGLLHQFNSRTIRCAVCDTIIERGNLGYMKKCPEGLLFYCDHERDADECVLR
jgi:hypothetical protein